MQTCDFLFPFEALRLERHIQNTPFSFTVVQKFILNDSLDFKLFVFFSGYIEDLFTKKLCLRLPFLHRNLN